MGGSFSVPVIKSQWHEDAFNQLPLMTGKNVAITGSTTGMGYVAASDMVCKGARVIMLNRPSERAKAAEARVRERAANGGTVEHVDCDLMDFGSVRAAAEKVLALVDGHGLDVLCNNAGVMALPEKATKDGYDVQMQTNHLSHFLLTSKLMPALEFAAQEREQECASIFEDVQEVVNHSCTRQTLLFSGDVVGQLPLAIAPEYESALQSPLLLGARVVNHSSGARKGPPSALNELHLQKSVGKLGGIGSRWERYHQTKLANVVFTVALQDALTKRGSKVKAFACAPGFAASNLQKTTVEHAGGFGLLFSPLLRMAQSPEDGALPMLKCMCDPELAPASLVVPAYRGFFGWLMRDGSHGPPKVVDPEPLCTKQESQDVLWKRSEDAVGPFFA